MEYSVLGFGHCIGSSDFIMRFFPGKVVKEASKTFQRFIFSFPLAIYLIPQIDIQVEKILCDVRRSMLAYILDSITRGRYEIYRNVDLDKTILQNQSNISFLLRVCFSKTSIHSNDSGG